MILSFDYVQYDSIAASSQNVLRATFKGLEQDVLHDGRRILLDSYISKISSMTEHRTYRDLALNALTEAKDIADGGDKPTSRIKLEEAYYWCGKFIRLDTVKRLKGEIL